MTNRTLERIIARIKYPPPLWKRVGGINAVVTRADGSVEKLGTISDIYSRRWGVGQS